MRYRQSFELLNDRGSPGSCWEELGAVSLYVPLCCMGGGRCVFVLLPKKPPYLLLGAKRPRPALHCMYA